jgi:hypothetical protein
MQYQTQSMETQGAKNCVTQPIQDARGVVLEGRRLISRQLYVCSRSTYHGETYSVYMAPKILFTSDSKSPEDEAQIEQRVLKLDVRS